VPRRVADISETLDQITAGDLKLRVRVLEGERAARRAAILQIATLQAVAGAALLDVGTQLGLAGKQGASGALLSGAAAMGVLVLLAMRRVKRLDKFERDLRNGNLGGGGGGSSF
jgi:disease resistance protein RPM1